MIFFRDRYSGGIGAAENHGNFGGTGLAVICRQKAVVTQTFEPIIEEKNIMMNKVMLLGVLVLCSMMLGSGTNLAAQPKVFTYDYTFVFGSEPDGFRGIKWQTNIATLDPLNTMEVIEIMGPFTYYKKIKEDLRYGTADLVDIIYEFWNGKFSGVILKLRGEDQFQKLKEYCFARFGEGQRSKVYAQMQVQDYYYNGVKTRMYLRYSDIDRMGELTLYSIALLSQQQKMNDLYFRENARQKIDAGETTKGR